MFSVEADDKNKNKKILISIFNARNELVYQNTYIAALTFKNQKKWYLS